MGEVNGDIGIDIGDADEEPNAGGGAFGDFDLVEVAGGVVVDEDQSRVRSHGYRRRMRGRAVVRSVSWRATAGGSPGWKP